MAIPPKRPALMHSVSAENCILRLKAVHDVWAVQKPSEKDFPPLGAGSQVEVWEDEGEEDSIDAALELLLPMERLHLGEAVQHGDQVQKVWAWYAWISTTLYEALACCVSQVAPSKQRRSEKVNDLQKLARVLRGQHMDGRGVPSALLQVMRESMELRKVAGCVLVCASQTPWERLVALRQYAAGVPTDVLHGPRVSSSGGERSLCTMLMAERNKRVTAAIGLGQAASEYIHDCLPEVQARRLCVEVTAQLLPKLIYHAMHKHAACKFVRAYPAALALKGAAVLEECPCIAEKGKQESHRLLVGTLFSTFCPAAQQRAATRILKEWDVQQLVEDAYYKQVGKQHFICELLALMSRQGPPQLTSPSG